MAPIRRLRRTKPFHAAGRLGSTAFGAACFAAATAYLAVAYAVVFTVRIGPVVADIDRSAGMGVHAGDVLAIPCVVLAIVSFLIGVVSLDEGLRGRRRSAHQRSSFAPGTTIAVLPTLRFIPQRVEVATKSGRPVLRPVGVRLELSGRAGAARAS